MAPELTLDISCHIQVIISMSMKSTFYEWSMETAGCSIPVKIPKRNHTALA